MTAPDRRFYLSTFLIVVALAQFPWSGHAAEFDPGVVGFQLHLKDEVSSLRVTPLFVLPYENVPLRISGPRLDERIELTTTGGRLRSEGPRQWTWTAPSTHGPQQLVIARSPGNETMTVQAFVMIPLSQVVDERLNGYLIGKYPSTPLQNLAAYERPGGLIEVTEENAKTLLTPHFTLGQFLCKQPGGSRKYVVLRERLLFKLEHLLEAVNQRGIRADSFFVMSGYRTPSYNRAIGNNTSYSRHAYGDAADIFIDVNPKDGVLDDLNGDGRSDFLDTQVLYDLVEEASTRKRYVPFLGGLARYRATSQHGPFVHVDARGTRARW